ncbi:hypothetical protein M501DRAFT_926345 [Patellaria atrata CBS 101060]|uniref:Uncharacterized protein n=1 Tax=Patellaria atrata CBS 101060 TaxID=1346257 RepID=A0A9P4SHD5_9PEZI|nr:hypothetical protein M501DRAFT_926345 [Patellaria atrata CBS 101060]
MATTTTKPQLSALKTPASATFPSELRSPMVGTPTYIKLEDGKKTPITPPAAYVDFLKALSPVLMSPLATGQSTKFNFTFEKPLPSATSVPTDRPSPTRTSSAQSFASTTSSCCSCNQDKKENPKPKPVDLRVAVPDSPFTRPPPMSARTPRRLHIPQSPYSPAGIRSPLSAHSVHSPYSAAMSPREYPWDSETGRKRSVSVRQVVTRTVTYCSTPLDPAPKGKRRKLE